MTSPDILTSVIFYLCAILIISCSIGTIISKKIIHSLALSVVVFIVTAGLFFLLTAEYNAVIQIAIYGIGIPILLVFAIMFTSQRLDKDIYLSFTPRFMLSLISAVLFVLTIFNILLISSSVIDWLFTPQSNISINRFEMMNALSTGLYVKYFFAFELISLLIFLVIVGLSTLNIFKEKKHG